MGDKGQQLETAVSRLEEKGLTILQTSSQIETAPGEGVEQDSFPQPSRRGRNLASYAPRLELRPC